MSMSDSSSNSDWERKNEDSDTDSIDLEKQTDMEWFGYYRKMTKQEKADYDDFGEMYDYARAREAKFLEKIYRFPFKFTGNHDRNPPEIEEVWDRVGDCLSKLRVYDDIVGYQEIKGVKIYKKSDEEIEAGADLDSNSPIMLPLFDCEFLHVRNSYDVASAIHMIDSYYTGAFIVPSEDIKLMIAVNAKHDFEGDFIIAPANYVRVRVRDPAKDGDPAEDGDPAADGGGGPSGGGAGGGGGPSGAAGGPSGSGGMI